VNRAISDSSRRATILSIESMFRRLAYGLFSATVLAWLLGHHTLAAALVACAAFGGVGVLALALAQGRLGREPEGELAAETSDPTPVAQPVAQSIAASRLP